MTAHQSTVQRFASWAPWYDQSLLQGLLFEPVHHTVLELLDLHAAQGARMLDVGCGTGRLAHAAARRYAGVVGLDFCPQMLEVAKRRREMTAADSLPSPPAFVCATAERLPFASGAFEVVTSTLSLRHWQNAERGIHELARVLSQDGALVIADIEPGFKQPAGRRRYYRRPTTWLGWLAARLGLEVVEQRLAPVRPPVGPVHVLTARHPRP